MSKSSRPATQSADLLQVDAGRRRLLLATLASCAGAASASSSPVRIGVDAEFGLKDSTSAQAIELGLRIAIAEVNASGGVIGGRPLELVIRDNRSMPARAIAHLNAFAAMPDLVAVFGGKFSPVMMDVVPIAHELRVPLMAVWSSADPIVNHGRHPNFVFRLALQDSLQYARQRKQFGQPIAAFQSIQHMLADMATELAAARALMLSVARSLDLGVDARAQASMAKLYCSETAFRIADRAVQIHGGEGIVQGRRVEFLFRMLRMYRVLTGTSEIQRNTIARELLQNQSV